MTAVLFLMVMSVVPGCVEGDTGVAASGDPDGSPGGAAARAASPLSARITVLAASSLTEVLDEMAQAFRLLHPGVEVKLVFGASSALVRQVVEGAPADVLATADEESMNPVDRAGRIARSVVFATNRLAIAVAPGNPERVQSLSDLDRPGLVLVLCAAEVPCGRRSSEALRSAGVDVRPASLEPNVKAVVSRVALGEADAGIVYVTDLEGPTLGTIDGVEIPDAQNVVTPYPAAVLLSGDRNREAASGAFVDFLASVEGRNLLTARGFGLP